jgi:hypothetical protein
MRGTGKRPAPAPVSVPRRPRTCAVLTCGHAQPRTGAGSPWPSHHATPGTHHRCVATPHCTTTHSTTQHTAPHTHTHSTTTHTYTHTRTHTAPPAAQTRARLCPQSRAPAARRGARSLSTSPAPAARARVARGVGGWGGDAAAAAQAGRCSLSSSWSGSSSCRRHGLRTSVFISLQQTLVHTLGCGACLAPPPLRAPHNHTTTQHHTHTTTHTRARTHAHAHTHTQPHTHTSTVSWRLLAASSPQVKRNCSPQNGSCVLAHTHAHAHSSSSSSSAQGQRAGAARCVCVHGRASRRERMHLQLPHGGSARQPCARCLRTCAAWRSCVPRGRTAAWRRGRGCRCWGAGRARASPA